MWADFHEQHGPSAIILSTRRKVHPSYKEEDADLRLLEQRKLEAMRRRLKAASPAPKEEKTDRQLVEGMLYDRGDEVLRAAYSYYPAETDRVVKELAGLIRGGRLREKVAGGELLSILRQQVLRVRVDTSIRV